MQMLITLEHRQHKISFSGTRMSELGSQGCQGSSALWAWSSIPCKASIPSIPFRERDREETFAFLWASHHLYPPLGFSEPLLRKSRKRELPPQSKHRGGRQQCSSVTTLCGTSLCIQVWPTCMTKSKKWKSKTCSTNCSVCHLPTAWRHGNEGGRWSASQSLHSRSKGRRYRQTIARHCSKQRQSRVM